MTMPGGGAVIGWPGQQNGQNGQGQGQQPQYGQQGQQGGQTQQGQPWQVQPQPQQNGQPNPGWMPQPPVIVRDGSNGIQFPPTALPPVQPTAQPGQQQPYGAPWGQQQPAPAPNGQQSGQPQGLQVGENTILDGPGVPPELRGRSMAEFNKIYTGLRQIALQATQPGQIPQPQPIPAPQPQPQPGVQQPGQQGQQPQLSQADFMRDPMGSVSKVVNAALDNAFQQKLMPMLAPIAQQSNQLGVQAAMQQVANEIGPQVFQQLLPEIQQNLQGIHPSALANPAMWRVAAQSVAGARALAGQPIPQGQPNYTFGQPAQPYPGFATPIQPYPVQVTNGQPIPNANMFWSEPPGGQRGSNGMNGVSLTPEEKNAARMMNMSESDYAAWKGGAAR